MTTEESTLSADVMATEITNTMIRDWAAAEMRIPYRGKVKTVTELSMAMDFIERAGFGCLLGSNGSLWGAALLLVKDAEQCMSDGAEGAAKRYLAHAEFNLRTARRRHNAAKKAEVSA